MSAITLHDALKQAFDSIPIFTTRQASPLCAGVTRSLRGCAAELWYTALIWLNIHPTDEPSLCHSGGRNSQMFYLSMWHQCHNVKILRMSTSIIISKMYLQVWKRKSECEWVKNMSTLFSCVTFFTLGASVHSEVELLPLLTYSLPQRCQIWLTPGSRYPPQLGMPMEIRNYITFSIFFFFFLNQT